jgi:hypothetical protein
MLRALLFVAGCALAGAAAAQHKWVDSNGRVQYGDTPPAGVKSTPVRPPPAPLSQPEASATKEGAKTDEAKKGPLTNTEKDADFRKRQQDTQQEREKQAKAQQAADDKRENCARAQEAVRGLDSGRIARTNASGERYFLDDAQLAQETVKARQTAQQWCN